MINEKVGTGDQISFILNGKPINPGPPQPTWQCPKCGVDQLKALCPLEDNLPRMIQECPMVVKAQ